MCVRVCVLEVSPVVYSGRTSMYPDEHKSMMTFLIFQTKDKMCDIIDTTYLYPFSTTIVAKTTFRSKEGTAGRDPPSTSHPPTSVPTEGKVEATQIWNKPRVFLPVVLPHWLNAFAGTIFYCYWCVSHFEQDTFCSVFWWKKHKHASSRSHPLRPKESHSRWNAAVQSAAAVFVAFLNNADWFRQISPFQNRWTHTNLWLCCSARHQSLYSKSCFYKRLDLTMDHLRLQKFYFCSS